MPIDPYSPCPCGSGKKVKFCCCADLVQELDKVERMLEGDQAQACLDYLRKLDEKHPGRPAIMALRAPLEHAFHYHAQADEVLNKFLADQPTSAVALALKAIITAGDEHHGGDTLGAIQWLQQAIEACGQQMPTQVYDAIGTVAAMLLGAGHIVPARAHLQLQLGITQAKDDRAVQALLQVEGAPGIPLPLKDMPPLEEAPAGVPWREPFQAALDHAQRGNWKKAADAWAALASQAGDTPALWRNLATIRSFLGNYAGAVEALRKFQSLSVPLDDAVEAEALAQLLAKDAPEGQVEEVSITYEISNAEAAQEKLAGDKRIERLPIDTAPWTMQNEPPPRGGYSLLDRPVPGSGVGIARDAIPNQLAQGLLFGKQTDREARLELMLFRPELAAAKALLSEVLGDSLGAEKAETVIGHLGQVEHALSWHWRLPDDTPDADRRQLALDHRREMVIEHWPKLKMAMLHGCAPEQVASDPSYRARLLAGIWLLQLADGEGQAETYNALRRKLKLPELNDVPLAGLDVPRLPLARIARLNAEALSDDQLKQAFNRAAVANFTLALRRLAPEVIRRPNLDAAQYKLSAYRLMVRMAPSAAEAMRLIEEARTLAESAKQSSAPWDLMELAYRVERGEMPEVMRLIDHIQRQHGREPGVGQALAQLLMQTGLIGPDGRFTMPMGAPTAAASPLVMPGASAEGGKLWTPDSVQPAGEKKSALWVPE